MDSRWKNVSGAVETMSLLASWGMPSPDAAALSVKGAARFIYFGIKPEIGVYVSPEGLTNLDPWPMYQLTNQTVANEEEGIVYFLSIQVSDGSPVKEDRNANRLANSLGPPVGHPAFLNADPDRRCNEYILLRYVYS